MGKALKSAINGDPGGYVHTQIYMHLHSFKFDVVYCIYRQTEINAHILPYNILYLLGLGLAECV